MSNTEEIDPLEPLPHAHSNESAVSCPGGSKTNHEWMEGMMKYLETENVITGCCVSQAETMSLASTMMISTSSEGTQQSRETDIVTKLDCNTSGATITLGSDMLSGIGSQVMSEAMDDMNSLSLDTKINKIEAQSDNSAQEPKKQQAVDTHHSAPLLRCVHEGLRNVYHLNDPENLFTSETNGIAIKLPSDQFPDENQLAHLENERKMSNLLSDKCSAIRAALNITLPNVEMEGCSSSHILCLEWVPGVTLKKWVHDQGWQHRNEPNDNAGVKRKYEACIHIAQKIATSLSEVHEAGGVVLNNISTENIIIDSSSSNYHINDIAIHFIGIGEASLFEKDQESDNNEIRSDLRSLGGVFFELFSGQSPCQSQSVRNDKIILDKKIYPSFVISSKNNCGGEQGGESYRHLRELRSILSTSSVPSQVAAFILELMGVFELSSNAVFDDLISNHYCYNSAREVHELLEKMISNKEEILPNNSSQESPNTLKGLIFPPNMLYGREEHRKSLMSAFERVILRRGECEVILVTGPSGTGKTAFVKQTLRQRIISEGGHFLHVKFDQLCQAKPLAAILAVLTDYFDSIFAANGRNLSWFDKLLEETKATIGMEGTRMLAGLIPSFGKIFGFTAITENNNSGDLMSQNRLNFLFQAFVRVLVSPESPMILFLDDLQWADDSSLRLVRALIMDSENNSVFFVESYRTNDMAGGYHPLSAHISDLKENVKLNEIQINNLNDCDVNELLSDVICEPQSSTEPLSNMIYRKTGGNALQTIEFVKSLWDEGLIWFSFYCYSWKWNEKLIESKDILEDAAYVIAQKISYFCVDFQLTLKLMACLGSQCEKSTLCLIKNGWNGDGTVGIDETIAFVRNLNIAVHEGILDKVGSKYKFAHDQIQLAAYSLIPKCEQSSWHLRIGQLLIDSHTDEQLEAMLFLLVDQLNRGKEAITEECKRIHLAELNLRAGKKAKVSGVFSSSAVYFAEGISLLNERYWNDNYELMLNLYTAYGDSESRSGAFEKMNNALQCVLKYGRCFEDKLLAYYTLILSLFAQKNIKIAIETGLYVLEIAGQPIPADADVSIIQAEMLKIKRLLDGKDIQTLTGKTMEDKQMIKIMEILESLVISTYHTQNNLLPLFICRMVELTVRHGTCKMSAYGFAVYSVILYGMFGDAKRGNKYAKLSLSMMAYTKAWHKQCKIFAALYGFVFPRSEPLSSCLQPLMNAYQECTKMGENEYAIINATIYSAISFQAGKDLESIAKFLSHVEKKAIEYNQTVTMEIVQPSRQTILNLMGRTDSPAMLEGEAISFKEFFSRAEENQRVHVSARLYLYQMRLAFMFEDLELAVQMATKFRNVENNLLGKFECCEFRFYDCLICFTQGRRTNSEGLIELAYESFNKMEEWAKDAPCNCEHKLVLLHAEQCHFSGKEIPAIEKYESAITLSSKNGFIQDHALSCERTAAYYLENGDESKASYYYGKAHDAYLEWGAKAKADHMCRHSPF